MATGLPELGRKLLQYVIYMEYLLTALQYRQRGQG
jgi:hypothetical protein